MNQAVFVSSLFSSKPRVVAVTAFTSIVGTLLTLTLLDKVALSIPTAIVTSAIALFAALLTQTWLADRQHKRDILMKLRDQKVGPYEDFLSYWMDMLMLPESREQWSTGIVDQKQLVRDMTRISKPLLLWASNDVVRAYSEFKSSASHPVPNDYSPVQQTSRHMETLLLFEQFVFRMREDVGHDPDGSKQYDILAFFVNDLDKYKAV